MNAHLRARLNKQDDKGFVVALVAISLFGLTLVAAFGVDLGSWYLQATKLQRAADASALAGAMALPDTEQAIEDATSLYGKNSLVNGVGGIDIVNSATPESFGTTIKNSSVQTYFVKSLIPHISMTRHSTARRSTTAPHLGSPYNVLGSGNLAIPSLPKQNFWLAVNGECSPTEDGDFFSARWDHNKGPFTGAFKPSTGNSVPVTGSGGAKTHCKPTTPDPTWLQRTTNTHFNHGGYSYFVDVPPPPIGTPSPSLSIKIYDPTFGETSGGDLSPDVDLSLPKDTLGASVDVTYVLWNINGHPEDETQQIELARILVAGYDGRPHTKQDWLNLGTISGAAIASGGNFRVQVIPYNELINGGDRLVEMNYGINSFSIGAFASWESGGSIHGCDSRTDIYCPSVYGRDAISVFNSLIPGGDGKVPFPLAELDPTLTGSTFTLYLWDPGEGTKSVSLAGPDGTTPIPFSWSTPSLGGAGYSGMNVTSIDTSNSGCNPVTLCPQPGGSQLSNGNKFNDRLITLTFQLPADYADEVEESGNAWTYLVYQVGAAPSDRVTYGMVSTSAPTSPPHLVRWDG